MVDTRGISHSSETLVVSSVICLQPHANFLYSGLEAQVAVSKPPGCFLFLMLKKVLCSSVHRHPQLIACMCLWTRGVTPLPYLQWHNVAPFTWQVALHVVVPNRCYNCGRFNAHVVGQPRLAAGRSSCTWLRQLITPSIDKQVRMCDFQFLEALLVVQAQTAVFKFQAQTAVF